jgi:hypothetical protein
MPWSLRRYQQSGQTHYLTISCYRRLPKLGEACLRDLAVRCLERTPELRQGTEPKIEVSDVSDVLKDPRGSTFRGFKVSE